MSAIVYGMSNADYHALDALGSSGIKLLRKSPAHFYGNVLDPQRPHNDPTPAMRAGTLAHCAILEPDQIDARYVVKPEGLNLSTKVGKEWAAGIADGVEVITTEQMQTAQRQASAVRALPEIGHLFSKGRSEVSAFWTDEPTNTAMKCRPDYVAPAGDGVLILDIKTAQDASPQGFSRAAWNFRYDIQNAHYVEGFAQASGMPVLGFVFVVVESAYPHAAAAYVLDDADLLAAHEERRRLIDLYAMCKRNNHWPGYPANVQTLKMPAWAKTTTTEGEL